LLNAEVWLFTQLTQIEWQVTLMAGFIKPNSLLFELLSGIKPVLPFGLRKITGNVRSIIKNFMKIKQVNGHLFMQSSSLCEIFMKFYEV
jgi:hypothetical protein